MTPDLRDVEWVRFGLLDQWPGEREMRSEDARWLFRYWGLRGKPAFHTSG